MTSGGRRHVESSLQVNFISYYLFLESFNNLFYFFGIVGHFNISRYCFVWSFLERCLLWFGVGLKLDFILMVGCLTVTIAHWVMIYLVQTV